MKNKNRFFTLATFLAVFLIPALSFAEDAAEVISRLQKKYESISSLKADFSQEVASKGMPSQKSEGRVWFKKPGKMRWEYQKPSKDLIVSDGETIWLYQPDLNQVIEKSAASTASAMATDFLSGIGDIEKDFAVALSGSEGTDYLLTLTPRDEQPGMRKLLLAIDKETYTVRKTVITDHFGNETSVTFRNLKTNPSLKDSLFRYKPPKGASVVRP